MSACSTYFEERMADCSISLQSNGHRQICRAGEGNLTDWQENGEHLDIQPTARYPAIHTTMPFVDMSVDILPRKNFWETEDEDADENVNCVKDSQAVDQLMETLLNHLYQDLHLI